MPCVTCPWAPLRVCLTSVRLSPSSTVEGLPKYIIVFIHFLCPARGEKERETEEGREIERDGERRSAERLHWWKDMKKNKGHRGKKVRKGLSVRHCSRDFIRTTVCHLIRINTHEQRGKQIVSLAWNNFIYRENWRVPNILCHLKLNGPSKDRRNFKTSLKDPQNYFLTVKMQGM